MRSPTATSPRDTIGHEITHGFDDQGRQYDAKGNLSDWWTAQDTERIQHAAQRRWSTSSMPTTPLPGLHINGKASLGENIAEYGGLLLGLEAFKKTDAVQAGQSDRRTHADAALLPRLRARLDESVAARKPRGTREDGCPFTESIPVDRSSDVDGSVLIRRLA